MRVHPVLLTCLLLALAVPTVGATATEDTSTTTTVPQVWLEGAFGRVPGGDPRTPAAAAPDGSPLDTWIREAPLSLLLGVPPEDVVEVSVTARAEGDDVDTTLSSGATMFAGPADAGVSIVTATVVTVPHGSRSYSWLVSVPDRAGGEEALLEIPGPQALLVSVAGSVGGEPGNGCYLYLCVDVGYRPRLAALEPLDVAIDETPSIRLDDGSAMVGWAGTLTPQASTPGTSREAAAAYPAAPAAVAELAGLEPTAAGDWLLEVRTDFDRQRGWQWWLYRLRVE